MEKYLNWLHAVGDVLAIVVAVYVRPPLVANTYRGFKNKWSLRSRERTAKRLAELEVELQKLDVPIDMQAELITFYNWVVLVMTFTTSAAMCGTGYLYAHFGAATDTGTEPQPSVFLAFSLVFFMFATVISLWGMIHFSPLSSSQRRAKRQQIETSIRSMRDKLGSSN